MKKQNFEEGLKRLEEIATLLDRGETDLENAMSLYEEGKKLSQHLGSLLEKAERKLSIAEIHADATSNEETDLKKMQDLEGTTSPKEQKSQPSAQRKGRKSATDEMPTLF